MATELIVIALPHTSNPATEDDDFHVSLFVSPKLGPDGHLRDYPAFLNWTRKLGRAVIELHDQDGAIECEALLGKTDPAVWPKLFPGRTPIRGQSVPAWQDHDWNSFDTRNVTALAKIMHATSVLASPTSPPKVVDHPLTAPMQRFTEDCYRPDPRYSLRENRLEHRMYDESIGTRALDEYLRNGGERLLGTTGFSVAEASTSAASLTARMAVELHRARRFYERPESEQAYQERPTEQAKPLPEPEPEFHERCVACGDHPALLRKLGLVVDLVVHDLARLAAAEWLEGSITVADATCHTTQTRCRTMADGSMVTVATTDDWEGGALTLGREDRFQVLDVDADGSALKSERFLWSIPRLAKIEDNGDDIHAASPALRAYGFTVARTGQAADSKDRIARQQTLAGSITSSPALFTEDVTRGVRVEVWDDRLARWRSLHRRLTDVLVDGVAGPVLDDLDDEGFIQGTAASRTPGADDSAPVYVHEAMFGWEGWSLSAPRPGRRIRKATPAELAVDPERTEIVEDNPTTRPQRSPHPLTFSNRATPGTLPRLRFGRSYAFRAWQVDLAGNTRPHELNPPPAAPEPDVAHVLQGLLPGGPVDGAHLWSTAFRQATHESLSAARLVVRPELEDLPGHLTTLVAPRLAEVSRGRAAPVGLAQGSLRRTAVAAAAQAAVDTVDHPLVLDTAVSDARPVSSLVASQAGALNLVGPVSDLAVQALATVTALRPFLRWDPVQPPAVVARRPFTEGESLRVLVVRSGVTQDPATLELTVTDPTAYAEQVKARHRDYHSTSERHLAPPKTTQMTAELHGKFDGGIGDSASEKARSDAALALALTEDGSFLDRDRADLDHPAKRIKQPHVRLVDPPVQQTDTPLKKLPLQEGESLAPGQYVVHDVDDLTIPYLPDPLAEGVSLVFPEAGTDRPVPLPFPYGGEGFTAAYAGDWPRVEPYRLVLAGADELGGRVEGRVIRMRLPSGDVQRLQLSSSIPREDLDLLGPWRTISSIFTSHPEVVEAAADGWLWGLSPSESVMLVHAVPRPLAVPRPTTLVAGRTAGQTSAWLGGGLDVHGPSTDSVTAEASWTDPVDDLAAPGPDHVDKKEKAFQIRITDWEDVAVLSAFDVVGNVPGFGPVEVHRAVHEFGDTRHHRISYRFRATTRFREYFAPDLLAPDPTDPLDDGKSVVAAPVVVDIPSSSRPAAPVVHSVIPLFRWDRGTEPEQPMGRRHVRRGGVRIYLERPWYSSGDGELLAVLLAPPSGDVFGPPPEDGSGFPWVSKVGGDPVWFGAEFAQRAMNPLQLDNLMAWAGLEDRVDAARPVRIDSSVTLPTRNGDFTVQAVGYQPQYNADRKLWYVDVALDPGATTWGFVRLAVARYQPTSIPGCELSMPARCDFVQLPPERTVSVSRTDASHVRVLLSGSVGTRQPVVTIVGRPMPTMSDLVDANRVVVARLQKRNPRLRSDLGWTTVAVEELEIRAADEGAHAAVWVGELDAGQEVVFRRPLDPADPAPGTPPSSWRVVLEEWERFPGDRPSPRESGPVIVAPPPIWEQRLVFADEVML